MRRRDDRRGALLHGPRGADDLADCLALDANRGEQGSQFDFAALPVHHGRKRGIGLAAVEVFPRHEPIEIVLNCSHGTNREE